MKILRSDLEAAKGQGIISSEQAQRLWTYFESLRSEQPRFHGLHVLYYFGGILILSSMSWFLTTAWENGIAIMAISLGFALVYLIVGRSLWSKPDLKIPGGLLITAAVGLTPVFIYGFQKATGLWPQGEPGSYEGYHTWVKGSWFFMELGTTVASVIALRFFAFPFLTFPLAFSLWYMSMDLTPLLFGRTDFNWDERKIVSCIFGLIMLIVAYVIDRKSKKYDYAFWTYLYGLIAFWGALTSMDSGSEFGKFCYFLINIAFIFKSLYLRRKSFLVFGTMGVLIYLGHLAHQVFKDSYAFPIVLALTGLFVVYLGIKYQRNQARFEAAIEKMLPNFLLKWRPEERA